MAGFGAMETLAAASPTAAASVMRWVVPEAAVPVAARSAVAPVAVVAAGRCADR